MFRKSFASAFVLLFVLSASPVFASDDTGQERDRSAPIIRFLKSVRAKGVVKALSDVLTDPRP